MQAGGIAKAAGRDPCAARATLYELAGCPLRRVAEHEVVMQHQTIPTPNACINCGASGLVDENSRCGRCLMDANRWALVLQAFEDAWADRPDRGFNARELHEGLDFILNNQTGSPTGTLVARPRGRAGLVGRRRASAWRDDDDRRAPNRLRKSRRLSDRTLEDLVDELGVSATTVALWEKGAPVPEEQLERLFALYGVSPVFLLGKEARPF